MKVSIIVPVYNVENYLPKCLDSLISQTLNDIEIIAVNDGATDSSPEILRRYAEQDSRIVVLDKPNGGLSDARNYGIPYATGDYIGFIDSDDFVDPEMYEVMSRKADETQADIVECNLHHTWEDHEDTEIGPHITDRKEMLMTGRSVVWNKIYNREWLLSTGALFPKGFIYEDVEFYSKIVPFINRIEYVEPAFCHYVQRSTSINNYQTLKTLQILDILDHIIDFYKSNGFYDEYRDALEFLTTRILLCSSLSRMSRIPAPADRNEAVTKNWNKLNELFPEWKNNKYLKTFPGRNGRFMRAMNPVTYPLAAWLLSLRK